MLGLPPAPGAPQTTAPSQAIQAGVLRAAPLSALLAEEKRAMEEAQSAPPIQGLVQHIRTCWQQAKQAKMMTVDPRLYASLRQRRGEYEPETLAAIKSVGGSEIYAMLTSVKCRAAASWVRDVMLGSGTEKPWTLRPTPMADLPPEVQEQVVQSVVEPLFAAMTQGIQPTDEQIAQALLEARDRVLAATQDAARKRVERMEVKMEDQLVEGGFQNALDQFIDDLTTFPAAILKGPVVRRRPQLKWVQGPDGQYTAEVTEALKLEWERVSPFNIYPAPQATGVDDGYLIERHHLTHDALSSLIGVEGYDEAAIRAVLDQYGKGGLRDWLNNDTAQASAEGRSTTAVYSNADGIIDGLQFWGTVLGKHLREWGMGEDEVPDIAKVYHVEAWLIGDKVIRAVLNSDPLHRKPYYKASYEEVPGTWWGNSVCDLLRDVQQVMNAAVRALANNMGMASGPQVVVNVDRLPAGEELTTLTPWKIWQVTTDPTGNSQTRPPIEFFQPDSRAAELLGIMERFSQLADEFSGIPRYLTGEATGGAGRTASGLSMLITNAGKGIKQVIANIDAHVMQPMLERLYGYNMRFAEDPELKGDVEIVARGAASLIAKESAQVRRNEFLAATANPIDMQITGVEGRAAVLREVARGLDMNTDAIVPPLDQLRQKLAAQAQMQMAAQMPVPEQGAPAGMPSPTGQELSDGAPVTDNFGPAQGA